MLVENNYKKMLFAIDEDLKRWGVLPMSFQVRLSVIKMNLLPRINFISKKINKKPISFPPWEHKGIHNFMDIIGQDGLREFHDLKKCYNLPGSSFFFIYSYVLPCDLMEFLGDVC